MGSEREAKRIIADGYDRLGSDFAVWDSARPSEGRAWFLNEALSRLPEGATVLELGCGPGTDAGSLSRSRPYVGVDLSATQLSIARRRAPGGLFVRGDLASIAFKPSSFDGVVAFYVFNHVPRDEVEDALTAAHAWLRPGGYLMLAGLPTFPDRDRVEDWLGVPMFFAGVDPDPEAYDRFLARIGFLIEMSEVRFPVQEVWGVNEPRWIIARKPSSPNPDREVLIS